MGDTVVIHAAGSGVGTAATQIVVQNGGTVIAVAGTLLFLLYTLQVLFSEEKSVRNVGSNWFLAKIQSKFSCLNCYP